jgi:hypothetical protein
MAKYGDRLRQVAMKGLDATERFLDSVDRDDIEPQSHARIEKAAIVGVKAVGNEIRHGSRENNREALELMREKWEVERPRALNAG